LPRGSVVRYEFKDDFEWIRVIDSFPENHRYLHFEDSIQGAIDLSDHHLPVFEYIAVMAAAAHTLCGAPGKILIGGLGTCTLHHAVGRFWPAARQISVESNSRIYELAKRFFRLEPRAKVLIGDLRHRLNANRKLRGFDLVLLDCYTATSIPPHLTSLEWVTLLAGTLAAEGVAIGNLWDPGCNDLCGDQIRTFLEVFGRVAVIDCRDENNLILCASANRRDWPDMLVAKGLSYPVRVIDRDAPEAWPEFMSDARVIRDDNLADFFQAIGLVF